MRHDTISARFLTSRSLHERPRADKTQRRQPQVWQRAFLARRYDFPCPTLKARRSCRKSRFPRRSLEADNMAGHIGIVACSAEGAALCYRTICTEAPHEMDEHNHPEITMHTYPLASYMIPIRAGRWEEVGRLMLASARKVAQAGAEFAICPDNTIHHVRSHRTAPGPGLRRGRAGLHGDSSDHRARQESVADVGFDSLARPCSPAASSRQRLTEVTRLQAAFRCSRSGRRHGGAPAGRGLAMPPFVGCPPKPRPRIRA